MSGAGNQSYNESITGIQNMSVEKSVLALVQIQEILRALSVFEKDLESKHGV